MSSGEREGELEIFAHVERTAGPRAITAVVESPSEHDEITSLRNDAQK
jgi:hypothetical protein